jgi:hypothetical protein
MGEPEVFTDYTPVAFLILEGLDAVEAKQQLYELAVQYSARAGDKFNYFRITDRIKFDYKYVRRPDMHQLIADTDAYCTLAAFGKGGLNGKRDERNCFNTVNYDEEAKKNYWCAFYYCIGVGQSELVEIATALAGQYDNAYIMTDLLGNDPVMYHYRIGRNLFRTPRKSDLPRTAQFDDGRISVAQIYYRESQYDLTCGFRDIFDVMVSRAELITQLDSACRNSLRHYDKLSQTEQLNDSQTLIRFDQSIIPQIRNVAMEEGLIFGYGKLALEPDDVPMGLR